MAVENPSGIQPDARASHKAELRHRAAQKRLATGTVGRIANVDSD